MGFISKNEKWMTTPITFMDWCTAQEYTELEEALKVCYITSLHSVIHNAMVMSSFDKDYNAHHVANRVKESLFCKAIYSTQVHLLLLFLSLFLPSQFKTTE